MLFTTESIQRALTAAGQKITPCKAFGFTADA